MVCTTFLHDSELDRPTSIRELNELIVRVREKTGQNWQVIERFVDVSPPWWKFWETPYKFPVFELYVYVGGIGPWQQINFYRRHPWSINLSNSDEHVIAYLYGVLAGVHAKEMKNEAV